MSTHKVLKGGEFLIKDTPYKNNFIPENEEIISNVSRKVMMCYMNILKDYKKGISDILCDLFLNNGSESDKQFLIAKRYN